MGRQQLRSWLKLRQPRRRAPLTRRLSSRWHSLDRLEDRTVPSTSIPLNGQTWTSIGPAPIAVGQSPGGLSSTGRVNAIAVDPTVDPLNPNNVTMYAAADTGGLWVTTDGGQTWSPRTDFTQLNFQAIATVHRAGGNTVYAFDQAGDLFLSKDGATTFAQSSPFEPGATVNKVTVFVVDPNDQTKDILYAAVGSIYGAPPSLASGAIAGSGIWRSINGGQTWTNIVDSTVFPFSTNPNAIVAADSLSFSDVVVDPTNPDVVYAAVGNAFGDPTNGLFKTINARSANPSWTLLLGGSSAVPGSTPGNIKLAIAPSAPSELFASLALRVDPQTGRSPLLGVFRSLDAGSNWSPVLVANPTNPVGDPNNFMGATGYDNDVVLVAPSTQANPNLQTVYLAGYGSSPASTVLVSTQGGAAGTFHPVGVNPTDGIGTYPNDHQGAFDGFGRLILATGGGVYAGTLNATVPVSPLMTWESLNGNPAATGLNVAQFDGLSLHPTDPNQAVGNLSFAGDGGVNFGPAIHNAVLFHDTGTPASAYGWQTVDAPNGIDTNVGQGQVMYNPFDPNIVYRTVPDDATGNFVRRSLDGGQTWTAITSGYQADPYLPAIGAIPYFTFDPSQPNRLFSGFNAVQVSDDNGTTWRQAMQIGTSGGTVPVPALPTTVVDRTHGGPIGITAIGVGRESGIDFGGSGINGVSLFVATTDDAVRNPPSPQPPPSGGGTFSDDDDTTNQSLSTLKLGFTTPQLWFNLIPTNSFPFPPPGGNPSIKYDAHSWANITPMDSSGNPLLPLNSTITQVIVDPSNNNAIYVVASTGQVFRGTNLSFAYLEDPHSGELIGYAPDGIELYNAAGQATGPSQPINAASITWTEITGNLPTGALPAPVPQGLALDSHVITNPTDDTLYAATSNGVWKLNNPRADFSTTPANWQQVGLDANGNPSLPQVGVSAIALNTTTGILAAATYGRGVYEIQARGLLSGYVFTDTNGNGRFDFTDTNGNGKFDVGEPGEPTIKGQNLTVELTDDNQGGTVVATTTTDATGLYEFRSITPGTYSVKIFGPAGQLQTTAPPTAITMTEQSSVQDNIGFFAPMTISGTKFNDVNNNGVRNTGEPGLAGVTIFLDANGNNRLDTGELSTTTAAGGGFSFTNLKPAFYVDPVTGVYTTNAAVKDEGNGTYGYVIREVPPVGWIQTTAPLADVLLSSGGGVANKLIGDVQISTIAGTAFVDTDGNGSRGTGEPPAAGFTVTLSGPGGTQTTTTAADGSYSFIGLAPGTYTVTETPPAGWVLTTTAPAPITVGQTDHITGVDFGNFKTVTLGGTVFTDTNGDGQPTGDPALGGVTVDLINASTGQVVATTVSATPQGTFSFASVGPLPGGGKYQIREELPTGYVQTTVDPPAFAPTSGTDISTFQFGDFKQYAVRGTAYVDVNRDGTQDAGDTPGSGFVIQLLGGGGAVVGQATSAADGSYTIPNVGPGSFTVVEAPRSGFQVAQGANGYPITGQSGTDITGRDFGNLQVATIRGTAFVDTNGNGSRGTGEPPAAGFTVQLSGPGGTQSTTTASDGSYTFTNLPPGTYTVTEQPPAGWVLTASPGPVTVGAGGTVPNTDFGNFKTVTLSGLAFNDVNSNGTPDANESGLAGVVIDLVNAATGAVTATATSNASGAFSFANVGPLPGGGNYQLVQAARAGFTQTTANPAPFAPVSGVDVNTFQFGDTRVRATVVTARGGQGGPLVTVRDAATGQIIRSFNAYTPSFGGGVRVATGLVNADQIPDIVTGAGPGGGPHVRVWDGATGNIIREFMAYSPAFTGGVYVAAADVNHDGVADIITGAGPGGGPHVKVFDGRTGAVLQSFFAFNSQFTGGVYVAAGDVNGDGKADVIAGMGEGGGPQLRVFDGATGAVLKDALGFPPDLSYTSGIRVGATDANGDGKADIIVAAGPGQRSRLRVLDGQTLADLLPGGEIMAFENGFLGGVYVAGS